MDTQEEHFEINETDNLIDNIEMVSHFLGSSIKYKWKWSAIALHQALYGALISVLQGTDPRQTVIDRQRDTGKAVMLHVYRVPIGVIASSFGKNEETIREWITNPYLISLDEALRRVKRIEHLPPLINARPLETSTEEDDAIRRLTKEFRNEFEHFSPKAWVVFTSGMPTIFSNILRVIRFLEFESNCVTMSTEQEQHLKAAIEKMEHHLKQ
ncbi:MAG: hypothetical protein JNM55_03325 [Anaerolineales bacterium]|nr:hypothetical protein [Anaerolineales bacterium]